MTISVFETIITVVEIEGGFEAMEKREKELLDGFKSLCLETQNTVITTVLMAVVAEKAVKRELAEKMAAVLNTSQPNPARGITPCSTRS